MRKKKTMRGKILSVAKKSFYEHGYSATTYIYLAKVLKTSPGSFSYYFSSKAALAGEVYQDVLYHLDLYVKDKVRECINDPLLHYAVVSRLWLELFRQDASFFRFYYEFGRDDIEIARGFNLLRICDPTNGLIHYDESNDERALITSATKGHSWFTNTAYFSGKLSTSYDYYCDYHLRTNLLLTRTPQDLIEEIILRSKNIVNSLHFTVLPYFTFQ